MNVSKQSGVTSQKSTPLKPIKQRLQQYLSLIKKQQKLPNQNREKDLVIDKSSIPNRTKHTTILPSSAPNWEVFNLLINQALKLKLQQVVEQDEEFIKVVRQQHQVWQEELKLCEQKRTAAKKFHSDIAIFLNLYVVVLGLMLVSAGMGVLIGLNTPEIVACRSEYSPCWHLRMRSKTIN